MTTIIGIALIVMAVFLVIAVLMQSSKDHRMGASIAGGAETFFGKTKGKSMDALFNKLTTVIAILFVILVIVLFVIQPDAVNVKIMNGDQVIYEGQVTEGTILNYSYEIPGLVGWSTTKDGSKMIDLSKTPITKDTTLYAIIEELPVVDDTATATDDTATATDDTATATDDTTTATDENANVDENEAGENE